MGIGVPAAGIIVVSPCPRKVVRQRQHRWDALFQVLSDSLATRRTTECRHVERDHAHQRFQPVVEVIVSNSRENSPLDFMDKIYVDGNQIGHRAPLGPLSWGYL
jgi:hypothetical protein